METDIKNLINQLATLQDKTQQLDDLLKDVRVRINDIIWDLVELKKHDKKEKIKK